MKHLLGNVGLLGETLETDLLVVRPRTIRQASLLQDLQLVLIARAHQGPEQAQLSPSEGETHDVKERVSQVRIRAVLDRRPLAPIWPHVHDVDAETGLRQTIEKAREAVAPQLVLVLGVDARQLLEKLVEVELRDQLVVLLESERGSLRGEGPADNDLNRVVLQNVHSCSDARLAPSDCRRDFHRNGEGYFAVLATRREPY